MAASSESLFNLVDQLQHLESTVTNLIFEMAFKLSSLTSTNIFVMVENNLGRKYAGKSHLCAEYATTGLKPLQNDIKVEFDPESGVIKECPQHRVGVPDDLDDNDDLENAIFRHENSLFRGHDAAGGVVNNKTLPNNNNKRRHPTRDSASSGEKRRRHYNRSLNIAVDPVAPPLPPPLSHQNDAFGSRGPEDSMMRVAKLEDIDDGGGTNYDDHHGGGGGGGGPNDDDVLIEEFTMDNGSSAASFLSDNNHSALARLDGSHHNNHFPAAAATRAGGGGDIMENNAASLLLSTDVDYYFKNNEKVAALRTLTFEVAGVEVNALAPAFKIMTSVLYDVAKMASATSPTRDKRDPHARAHFDKHFDRIMNEFPQLRMLTDQGVKVKTAGFGSFVRSTMQKTFGKLLDKAMQADNKYSENGLKTAAKWTLSPM